MEETYEYTPLKVEIPDLQKPDSDPRQLRAFSSHKFSNVFLVFGPDEGPNGPDFTLSTEVAITIVNPAPVITPTPTPTATSDPFYIKSFDFYRIYNAEQILNPTRNNLSVHPNDVPLIGMPDSILTVESGDPDFGILTSQGVDFGTSIELTQPNEDREYFIKVICHSSTTDELIPSTELSFVWVSGLATPHLTVPEFQTGDIIPYVNDPSRLAIYVHSGRRYFAYASTSINCIITRGNDTVEFPDAISVGTTIG
jgi:hypothetical protein